MRRQIIAAALGVLACSIGLLAQVPRPAVPLPRTDARSFKSKVNGFDYQVLVSTPASYKETTTRFPVIYLTDANWTFAMTVQTYQVLRLGKQIPEAIIVGVVRDGVDDIGVTAVPPRTLDLTPTRVAAYDRDQSNERKTEIRSGGAPEFLRVIKEEIIPDIESRYRATTDRTFIGYSLGGLFGSYVLFQSPETFKRMILVSPSLWWDDGLLLKREDAYAGTHKELPVRLFMSDGELEVYNMIGPMRQLASTLSSRNYKGLNLQTRIFEGENHTSTFPVAVTRGLKTVFAEEPRP